MTITTSEELQPQPLTREGITAWNCLILCCTRSGFISLRRQWHAILAFLFLFGMFWANFLLPRNGMYHEHLRSTYSCKAAVAACDRLREGFSLRVWRGTVVPLSDKYVGQPRRNTLIETAKHLVNKIPNGMYCIDIGDTSFGLKEWPVLSFSAKRSLVSNGEAVLIPDFEAIWGYKHLFAEMAASDVIPFKQRISRIHWRGATTGTTYYSEDDFNKSVRVRFLDYINEHKDLKEVTDVGFYTYAQFATPELQKVFESRYPLAPHASIPEALKYRYLFDVDGNANAYTRLAWSLMSGSLVLKHRSEYMQWYYPHLTDGVHYLSIAEDFSNLKERFDWAEQHVEEAENITRNAKAFARTVFDPKAIETSVVEAFRRAAEISEERAKLLCPPS